LPEWSWIARDAWWDKAKTKLLAFIKREGHPHVPARHIEDGFLLGAWVDKRRGNYREKTLSAERIAELEAIPGWDWNPQQSAFERAYEKLLSFYHREGHVTVKLAHVEDGFRLGSWVGSKRGKYRKGQLPHSQINALEMLDGWEWDRFEGRFQEGLEKLCAFQEREGHVRVPQAHVEDGFRLGAWVHRTRHGTLTPENREALSSLPDWSWHPLQDDFLEALGTLFTFQNREGHAFVPVRHVEEGLKLGVWVRNNQTQYKTGKLMPDKIPLLEAVPGWSWNQGEDRFHEAVAKLRAFAEREGHIQVTQTHVEDGFRLGLWASTRRVDYRKGKLSPERIATLEALPGWTWGPLKDRFEHALAKLAQFSSREGHARVLGTHVEDGFKLGVWVSNCRTRRRSMLNPEQVAALEAIPGWTWQPLADVADEAIAKAIQFHAREGHARVPALHIEDGFRLGQWIAQHRYKYRRGKLSQERVKALEAIPGWTWEPRRGQSSL
jgi:hypothetical protein